MGLATRSHGLGIMSLGCFLWLVGGTTLQSPPAVAQPADSTAFAHHTEWTPMRDGVLLASEVYLPKDARGRLSVVLMRSPYNGSMPEAWEGLTQLVARGYVVVNQDCRGTGRSHGVLTPFVQEQNDGYDTVEWAASQPWSNGKVGLWGASYLGVTVMQAAAMHPPHLVAVVASVTASDYHDNWTYANGVFDLWFGQSWVATWAANDAYRRQLLRTGVPWAQVQEQLKEHEAHYEQKFPDWLKLTPLDDFAEFKATAPFYYRWLDHPAYDRYWSAVDLEHRYGDIKVPILLIGGWYDIFSVGTVRNFLGLKSHGGTATAREQTKLVMAPICHGDCNETLKFATGIESILAMNPDWWDHWLRGIDNGVTRDPAVKLFVMALPETGDKDAGFWTTGNEYPLPRTKRVRFYLESRGHANTRYGDGVLLSRRPSTDEPDRFIYDPRNPVPTLGGNICCGDLFKPGVFDQSEVELRDDILVYTSDPLTKDLTIIGPVAVEFWATSSASDTDFTAKFVAVRPDGLAYNVLDRIINARQRRGSKLPPEGGVPGRAYHYRLDLGDTAVVLKAGFRVRLEISSSNFPHFARNPNTGRPAATEREFRRTTQTIAHNATHPSYLEMPVVKHVQ
ncbi:MAG TPA: CocE/NonD family hydrolase [Steroidobacteraceae bacterium]|nr:CocE/NonD family hydrolase [Steroidobacteraceae bacterium]